MAFQAPSTPKQPMTRQLDADYSNAATYGSVTPKSPMPSPVMLRRQNAQEFDDVGSSQQSEVPTETYLATPVTQTGIVANPGNTGDDGNGSDGPSDRGDGESESGDSDRLAIFLPSDSDSDVSMDPKERLNVRIARLHLEWRDYKDYNASFGEPCPAWADYKVEGLVNAGYSLRAGKWIKTGRATRNPRKPLRPIKAQSAGPSSKKKPAAKVLIKKSILKVALTSEPSPMKSMKAKSRGSAGSSKDKPSPKTPMKAMKGKPVTPKTPMKKVRTSKPMVAKSPATPKSKMQKPRKAAASSPSKKMK